MAVVWEDLNCRARKIEGGYESVPVVRIERFWISPTRSPRRCSLGKNKGTFYISLGGRILPPLTNL